MLGIEKSTIIKNSVAQFREKRFNVEDICHPKKGVE
jgi:hypothetical protein